MIRSFRLLGCSLLLPFLAAAPAAAQTAADPAAPATPAASTPICTDRPTKANVVCTVPEGAFQIETDLVNWARNTDAGVRTDTILYTNPTLKYGLGAKTDIEVNIAPYEAVHSRAYGITDRIGGVGDLYVRVKQQLTSSSDPVQVALIPYVKAPTARFGVGNKRWEGGVIAPVIFALPKGWTLNFGPEVDVLADGDRHGHHAQLVTLANLSRSFGKSTVYVEFWNAHNLDPAGTVHQYSADVGFAYLLTPRLQLDLGGNFGLNRFTPDTQVYLGLSTLL
jgi:hypothetical protein